MDKNKSFKCKIVKGKHLPLLMKSQSGGNGVWGLASVEHPDQVQDVVRISGISTKTYHSPPTKYLKILAGHAASLPSGSAPVIGRVEKFIQTTTTVDGKEYPALAFYMSFANTPLAKEYKSLMTEEPICLDSFSVGMRINDFKQIKGGGIDIMKSTLMEISVVAIPCNESSTVIQRLEKSLQKIKEYMPPETEETETTETPETPETPDKMDQLLSRLDDIESMLTVLLDQMEKEEDGEEEEEEETVPVTSEEEEKKAQADVFKKIAEALKNIK